MSDQESSSQFAQRARVFIELFAASTMSGLVVAVVSLLIIGTAIAPTIRANVQQSGGVSLSQTTVGTPAGRLHLEAAKLGQSRPAAALSLFLFWGITGMVAYLFIMSIKNAVGSVAELDQEMHYVNAHPRELLHSALLRSGIRVLVGIAWVAYAWVFAHLLLPYSLAAADTAAAQFPAGQSLLYLVLALGVISLGLHVHVIFGRLLALRVRIFSDSADTD